MINFKNFTSIIITAIIIILINMKRIKDYFIKNFNFIIN